ncbi:MAG: HEAT repeat domain-containing protein [Bacteroidota bacterium]
MADIKELNRQKRGQVSEAEVKLYEDASVDELSILLNSDDSKKRTIAAIIIGNQKILEMVPRLCRRLVIEKSLYSRIAVSEALGKMGEPAVLPLIDLLGKVGNNQETGLSEKYCEKKSYPLARDLAARTLVKIGKPAIPYLIAKIMSGDSFETQQAIDAIGGIISKTHDMRPLPVLLEGLIKYSNNEVTTWKIIRALSALLPDADRWQVFHL